MDEKFKVGDLVKVVEEYEGSGPEVGTKGVIVRIAGNEPNIGVDFSKGGWVGGHTCNDTVANKNSGYYMYEHQIQMVKPEPDKTLKALDKSIEHWEDNVLQLQRWNRADKEIKINLGRFSVDGCESFVSYRATDCSLCTKHSCTSLSMSDPKECPLDIYGIECNDDDSLWQKVKNSSGNVEIIFNSEKMLEGLLEVRKKYLTDKKEREKKEKERKERKRYTLDESDKEADLVFKLELSTSTKRVFLKAKKPSSGLGGWNFIADITPDGKLYKDTGINKTFGLKLDEDGRIIEGKTRRFNDE